MEGNVDYKELYLKEIEAHKITKEKYEELSTEYYIYKTVVKKTLEEIADELFK